MLAVSCHLSYLTLMSRELGEVITNCVHGFKYAVMGKDGVLEWKRHAGFLYVDDVCLMARH